LKRIAKGPQVPYPELVTVEPELVIRHSTFKAPPLKQATETPRIHK
jgi:hypothetical protein